MRLLGKLLLMKNQKTTEGIKKKIVTGFVLLLTLAFIAILSVIQLASQLSSTDSGVSSSVTKLTITSNLLSSIIGTDNHARAYINTGNLEYLYQYNEQEALTQKLLDSLKISSISNTNQYLRILAVDSLLDIKEHAYSNFFSISSIGYSKDNFDISQIVKRSNDTINIPNRIISKTVTEQLPSQQQKKKGFFPKLWNNITGKKKVDSLTRNAPLTKVQYDTVTTYYTIRDTSLYLVKSQLKRFQAKKKYELQQLADREMKLIEADQDVMNEIRAILLMFEKEEISKAISSTEKSRKINDRLWTTALILAAAGLLTTLIFIIMIWKDLAKSAFYRRQLEKARSFAESLLKVKEQFLANMSHEIRTPLTSIIGFTERLSETKIDNEQSRYLKYINSSSEHLLELINDLLDFSRIESGKFNLESKSFNLAELIEQAFETLAPRAKQKGLSIIIQQDLPSVNLVGDPLRLRQILLNLLNNSIKFTEFGKVILQTKATLSVDKRTAHLIIRIADTGIGIPKEKQESVFEEFSQVDASITRRYGGSGLGLAITRRLVELMDGSINLISREGRGTIFTVKISLPVDEHQKLQIETPLPSKRIDLDNIKILLAEDDPTTRMLITEFLESHKAIVVPTSDGTAALETFIEAPENFKIIITDIQMPRLSGTELIKTLREKCKSLQLDIPIVIGLTAHADQYEIEEYKAIGMDYFILKPFKNDDILNIFNQLSVKNNYEEKPTDGIDFSAFKKFAGDDDSSLIKILNSLKENLAITINEMQTAFDKKDYAQLSLLAHRVQPNIKLLGANEASLSLKKLELLSKEKDIDEKEVQSCLTISKEYLLNISDQLENSGFLAHQN